MRRFHIFLCSMICSIVYLSAQSNGNAIYYTSVPQNLPDGFDGSFDMVIYEAANDTLGQNGQGVCRVYLSFEHHYLGDLTMVLTAPNGQSVTLVGSEGYYGITSIANWNVGFTRCDLPAQPDAGKSPVWQNNQPWRLSLNQNFTGTYYPHTGCLEQLSGPVIGRWKLSILDHYLIDSGELKGFGIEFCDATGIVGNACRANAGNLTQSDMVRCTSDNPNLNLQPTYNSGSAPSSSLYNYKYAISRTSDDVLQTYSSGGSPYTVNLSMLDTGTYTICGVSYPEDADTTLPAPNGLLTMNQLRSMCNAGTGPLCVNVTSNCVNITLKPSRMDSILVDTICYPDFVMFFGIPYSTSGTYTRTFYENGCSYKAILKLTVYYPYTWNIRDTICAGMCSSKPGFQNACSTGVYTRILPAVYPTRCDTIVRLNLLVLNPYAEINAPVTLLDCARTSIPLSIFPNTLYSQITWRDLTTGASLNLQPTYLATHPGLYTLTALKKSGAVFCYHADTVEITREPYLIPVAASGGFIGCGYQTTQLNASAYGNFLGFNWSGPNGFNSNLRNPVVNTAGIYTVTVNNNIAGCSGTDSIFVDDISDDIYVNLTTSNDTISCFQSTSTLLTHTNIPNPLFLWDSMVTPANIPSPVVSQPGVYHVVVTSPYMLCTTTASITISADTLAPVITELEFVQPTQGNSNGEINIEATGAPEPFSYVWKHSWQVVGTWEDLWNIPAGTYMSIVTAANGCQTINNYTLTNRDILTGEDLFQNRWLVRPNPSTSHFSIQTELKGPEGIRMAVYDQAGRLIWHFQTTEDTETVEIDLSSEPEGMYFLEIMDGTGHQVQKLLVQR